MLPDLNVPIPTSTKVSEVDTLMGQLHKALSVEPVGSQYQPSGIPVRPDMTIAGGVVPTVRRYRILVDKIMIPYKDETGPVVGRDGYLEEFATEAELIAAGCNIDYLIQFEHIVEDGYTRVG